MKKTILISLGIVLIFLFITFPVISIRTNDPSFQEQQIQTIESTMYKKNAKMENIPFEPQEKPEFLSMQPSTALNPPNGNVIVVYIKKIRLLDESIENPEYYLNILINGEESAWRQNIITERVAWFEWPIGYKVFSEYSDSPLSIDIEIMIKNKMWFDTKADISPGPEKTLSLTYDPKRGDWSGGDYRGDVSGYGHATGFEDGNYNEKDFEIWFEIYQMETYNNYYLDGDSLTYWEETNIYNTDPFSADANIDFDEDGIPTYWEDRYGYDPFVWDNHEELDPDNDGLQNLEEFQTDNWCSHPFVQDIFIEVDFMEGKYFWNQPYTFSEESAYLLENAFLKRNIIIHIDLGIYGGGGELAPYQDRTVGMDLQGARLKYFLHGNPNHWRRGIFHWAFICSKIEYWDREVGGRMFYIDSFVLARQTIIDNTFKYIYMKLSNPTVGMASVFMHELGHTLGLHNFGGIDNIDTTKPWKLDFYRYRSYESCMNYHYTYKLIDYSDGNNAEYDQNDWDIIDLTRFEY
jgi:hypothetical protein